MKYFKRFIFTFCIVILFSFFVKDTVYADVSLDAGNAFCVRSSARYNTNYGDVGSVEVLAAVLADLIADQTSIGLTFYDSSGSELTFMPNYNFSIKYYSSDAGYGIWVQNANYSGWVHCGSRTAGFYLIHCHTSDYSPFYLEKIYAQLWSTYNGVRTEIAVIDRFILQRLDEIMPDIDTLTSRSYATYSGDGTAHGFGWTLMRMLERLDTIDDRMWATYSGDGARHGIGWTLMRVLERLDTISSSTGNVNAEHWCCFTSGATADRIDISYGTAEQIVALLNTDYVGKPIKYFTRYGNTYSYPLSYAYIDGEYIRVGITETSGTHITPILGTDLHFLYRVSSPNSASSDSSASFDDSALLLSLGVIATKLDRIDASINGLDLTFPSDDPLQELLVLAPATDTDEEETVTDFSVDLFRSGGRLLGVLYRVVFRDALRGIDSSLDDFEGFYVSPGSGIGEVVDLWD